MTIPFVNLKSQYSSYKRPLKKAINETIKSTLFLGGKILKKFESSLATYSGASFALGCSSGTTALQLALMALDIKEKDEIITSPFTFIATAEAIAILKAKPVFVDIDELTYNINPKLIEKKITKKTKAIIPVSLFGLTSNMDAINEIAKKHKLTVIEDASQSFGALYKTKYSCNLSKIACTSFYPSKPLGCYGDGGAIFTSDKKLEVKIRALLNHGKTQHEHSYIGINGRIDNIQAAILSVKLHYLNDEIKKRQSIANDYNEKLFSSNVVTPHIPPHQTSTFAQYSIRISNREDFIKHLNTKKIPHSIFYDPPIHLQKAFDYLNYKKGDFPIAEKISKDIISLPISAFLRKKDQNKIIEHINRFKH